MQAESATTAMSTILGNIGTVLESCIDWTASCGEMIVGTPILFIPAVLSIGLIGISIIKRFI